MGMLSYPAGRELMTIVWGGKGFFNVLIVEFVFV